MRYLTILTLLCLAAPLRADPPQTVAEATDYKATSRHADVVRFCEQLAKTSPLVALDEMGLSHERRPLPLLILADPPLATPAEARRSGKVVVFAMGNIHAGEVDGKEALLALARDVPLKHRDLLKHLVIVLCPIFNADGNERLSKTNRAHQAGPDEVGVRANAQGFDLNRDFVKLESPEVRSLVRLLNQWDPAVFVDCHTTNGSLHRYTLTYEGGRCPAGDAKLVAFTSNDMLPEIAKRMEKQTGYKSYFYGNFSRDRREWQTVPPTPRYGTHYVGLRNRIAILSESYVYASYKDRVLATKAFVHNILDYTAEHRDQIRTLLTQAPASPPDKVVLRYDAAPLGRPHALLGFVEEVKDGKRLKTGAPKSYEVLYTGGTKPLLSVSRPYAYLVPASYRSAIETLQRHGVVVEELREDVELDVEAYRVGKLTRQRDFQKHQTVSLEVTSRKETRSLKAGTVVVRTVQPLSDLVVFLLEPQSVDGLATWNFFDNDLKEGGDFPVLRLPVKAALTTTRVRALADEAPRNQPITWDTVFGSERVSFTGTPVGGLVWLDDEHFLQVKDERACKVHALTGRCHPLYDAAKIMKALAALPTIDDKAAHLLVASPRLRYDPAHKAALFSHQDDLYHATLDGAKAVRLTKSPGEKELATFSPDGKFVAYVQGHNLHVVDVHSQTNRALTSDGAARIRNGKASWVYFEEIFNRDWQSYWWSPDSKQIAFLRYDERSMPRFNVIDNVPLKPIVENTPYPKAGQQNPLVQLGIISVAGGPVRWVDLSGYSDVSSLVIRAVFTPDSQTLIYYVQDRAQTWLDVCATAVGGGPARRLFRETTKAWVEDLGAPVFLKDGSFLFVSERDGWRHLYHYERDGKLRRQVTKGEWEVRQFHKVDENKGEVYFSGTANCHLANNLYRIRLDGTELTCLTKEFGDHAVNVSPKATYFVDSWSSHTTPTRVRLAKIDGTTARTIDTNPVYVREQYRLGHYEMVKIKTPDGFVLEGSLLKPPDFDPNRRYPVWFMTYAGPHAPTISDSWGSGRLRDEMLAQMGFVIFRADPRTASGKGACSTWPAYKQLGVQEYKDIDTLIDWLKRHPWVDGKRVGMSGGSYGGFITAYAMTHGKHFAAGVSSAPVTDWRLYDSIYTERYMNTPQENPEGYDKTSVVKAAKDLHGKLLLVHGLMDDNVHAQNAIQLIDALQRAEKDFEVMVYPRDRHGIGGMHYQRLTVEFMKRVLKPGS